MHKLTNEQTTILRTLRDQPVLTQGTREHFALADEGLVMCILERRNQIRWSITAAGRALLGQSTVLN